MQIETIFENFVVKGAFVFRLSSKGFLLQHLPELIELFDLVVTR